jgi:hypothetical protein
VVTKCPQFPIEPTIIKYTWFIKLSFQIYELQVYTTSMQQTHFQNKSQANQFDLTLILALLGASSRRLITRLHLQLIISQQGLWVPWAHQQKLSQNVPMALLKCQMYYILVEQFIFKSHISLFLMSFQIKFNFL